MRPRWLRIVRRCCWLTFETVGLALALVIVAGGVLVWRVAQGPVPLDFLTDRLETELTALSPDLAVKVGGTVLAWEGWPQTFALRLRNVRLSAGGGQQARIPAVDLRLHVPALVAGTVAPTQITARGARLTLLRGESGFRFATPRRAPPHMATDAMETDAQTAAPKTAPDTDVSEILPALLDEVMAAPNPARRLSYLESLRITEARVTLHDTRMAAVWHAPDADVRLDRSPEGLTGTAHLNLAVGEDPTRLAADIAYRRGAARIDVSATLDPVTPAALAAKLPAFKPAAGVTVPLGGEITARFGLGGDLRHAAATLRGGAGTLVWPRWVPEPRPVRSAGVRLAFDAATQELRMRDLRVAFAPETPSGAPKGTGPVITGRATLTRESNTAATALTASAQVQDMPATILARYWPPGIQESGDARGWVLENVPEGHVNRARIQTALRFPKGRLEAVQLQELSGDLAYEDLSVHYLRPLAPVTGIDGTATFDAQTFRFQPETGQLGAVEVSGADVLITGLDLDDQFLKVDLRTEGPLAATLAPLAHPRLSLLSELGLDPAQTAGRASVTAAFALPLRNDLTFPQMQVQAQADLREVAIDDLVLDSAVRNGDLSLQVDKTGMNVTGPAELAGVPLTFSWRERFGDDATPQREIEAEIPHLNTAGRARLGLDARPYLDGPVAVNVDVRTDGNGQGRVQGAANLKDATLALDEVGWAKPAGRTGSATFDLRLRDDRPQRLADFRLDAQGAASEARLSTAGSLDLNNAGDAVRTLTLRHLDLDRTALRDITVHRAGKGWDIAVGGGKLDAEPFRDRLTDAGTPSGTAQSKEQAPGPPLRIQVDRLDSLRLDADHALDGVRLRARRDAAGQWREVVARASVPARFVTDSDAQTPAPGLNIAYEPDAEGIQRLRVTADNAGATLRALDALDSIEGGALEIDGRRRDAAPGSPLDAQIEMGAFRVRDAPLLARLLTVAFLTGINDVLRGDGLGFKQLRGEVTFDDSKLYSDLIHAYGPALGITAKGNLDLAANKIDLRGTVVPAALVNRILDAIPLIGRLLTGGEGEGVIAVTYNVRGPLDAPEIGVNPLSALTPGFLRGIFGLFGESEEAEGQPPKALPESSGR